MCNRIIGERCALRKPRVAAGETAAGSQPDDTLAAAPLLKLDADLPQGAGVYAVLDKGRCVQYIGVSRHVDTSLSSHAEQLPELTAFAKVWPIPSNSKAELQRAWKTWIVEHGSLPPGNTAPGDAAWKAKPAASFAKPAVGRTADGSAAAVSSPAAPNAPTPAQLQQRVAHHAHPGAQSAVTTEVLEQISSTGFAIVDQVSKVEHDCGFAGTAGRFEFLIRCISFLYAALLVMGANVQNLGALCSMLSA